MLMKQVKGELNWFPVTFACTRMKPRINLKGEANLGYKFLLQCLTLICYVCSYVVGIVL